MSREKLQHVVEEAYAGGNLVSSLAFHRQRKPYVRLRGGAVQFG